MKETKYALLKAKAIDRYKDSGISTRCIDNIWSTGWHNGKEDLLNRLIHSEFVIIDPDKIEDLKSSKNPCEGCEHFTTMLKIGCNIGKSKCKKWQEFSWHRDLYDWFIIREIPDPI